MEKREDESWRVRNQPLAVPHSPNPRAKPPNYNGKISCFELKTRNNVGAAGRKKTGIFIENLTEAGNREKTTSINKH